MSKECEHKLQNDKNIKLTNGVNKDYNIKIVLSLLYIINLNT